MSLFRRKKDQLIFLLLLFVIFSIQANQSEHIKGSIAIIGTGYVGLVSGACFAELGHNVTCADVDSSKIVELNKSIVPIYEEGLSDIIFRNVQAKRLYFTDDVAQAIKNADIIFIAVGTPMSEDGNADLSFVYAVIETIANNITSFKTIVTKSTVPVGTGKKIRTLLEEKFGIRPDLFGLASNPEFLKEGVAVKDFLEPDRIVIGTDSDESLVALYEVYEPLISSGARYVFTDIPTAEMIKYASNGFLSVKVSYINEIANLCDKVGADVTSVSYAMGLDYRISPDFLKPGPGFGGSCFPKDAQALLCIAQQNDLSFHVIKAALQANTIQQKKPVEKLERLLCERLGQKIEGKTVAVLGLAFKANTDDVRSSPAIVTIDALLKAGATVKAYDPIAMANMQKIFPTITYCQTLYDTVEGVDAIIIMTDWDEIKQMDYNYIKLLVNQPVLIDARNTINPVCMTELGFMCDTIGLSCLCRSDYTPPKKIIPVNTRKRMLSRRIFV